jgi:hypothetical protein
MGVPKSPAFFCRCKTKFDLLQQIHASACYITLYLRGNKNKYERERTSFTFEVFVFEEE